MKGACMSSKAGRWTGRFKHTTNLTEAVRLDPRFVDAHYMLFEAYVGDWADQLPPRYNRTNNYRWALDNLRRCVPILRSITRPNQ